MLVCQLIAQSSSEANACTDSKALVQAVVLMLLAQGPAANAPFCHCAEANDSRVRGTQAMHADMMHASAVRAALTSGTVSSIRSMSSSDAYSKSAMLISMPATKGCPLSHTRSMVCRDRAVLNTQAYRLSNHLSSSAMSGHITHPSREHTKGRCRQMDMLPDVAQWLPQLLLHATFPAAWQLSKTCQHCITLHSETL